MAEPAYVIPLSDTEINTLGKVCAVFSQIDYFMVRLTTKFLDLGMDQYSDLLGSKPLGVRLSALREGCNYIENKQHCALVKTFVDKLDPIVPKRNLIVHGCWGTHTPDYVRFRTGVHSHARPTQRLYADELNDLYTQACEASWLLVSILSQLYGLPILSERDGTAGIIWSSAEKPPDGRLVMSKGSVMIRVPHPGRDQSGAEQTALWKVAPLKP